MNQSQVPNIFSERRRVARAQRSAIRRLRKVDAATFLLDDIADDIIERLSFVRLEPQRGLVIGLSTPPLADCIENTGPLPTVNVTLDLAQPIPGGGFDFIAVIGQLDAVNDLPGALIHLRNAVISGGLIIVSFVGGQSLPALRAAMLAAEPERPSARIHPMFDPRSAPALLQRAGWNDPVVDTHTLKVRYSSLDRLVADLRDQGLGNALARPAPPLGKAALNRARTAFSARADADGKTAETFEIITLTGRRSLAGT